MDAENPDSDKSAPHSETSTPVSDGRKQTSHSTSPKLDVRIQHDILNKQPEHKKTPFDVGREFIIHQHAIEMTQATDISGLSRKEENCVVNVEPPIEAPQHGFIKDLIGKSRIDVPTSPAADSDAKTTETQQKKEVRVNIGRVEIKASQKVVPTSNPPVRGFDDYLMARVYLDRRYF